ncbi:hypothetical protein QJS10_CPA06g01041 [Acorus calamus]|uniref:Bowman-Birk serine protease inhibitors family domain-containing protein n=1 Tax=Acorus calamus TaxID=4465 RepID=A0AAV9EN19_ACOCL|nr:hypothetical protein QJS10_CPA06g01030 [Acorus calamus]KAK1315228.1 hypothetical protein QJS10_CPA06g01041 [Acorus calamus]
MEDQDITFTTKTKTTTTMSSSSSSPIALLLVVLMFSVVSHIPSSTAIDILDRFMMFDEGIMKSAGSKGEGVGFHHHKDCCHMCICTRSFPPQCRCRDVKTYCPSTWKDCKCTKSIPPQCTTNEIKDHCDPPMCNDNSATATVRAAGDR